MIPLRIGINALYLIPGGVGGTEIYLRNLLQGLSEIDSQNQYFVYTNRECQGGSTAPLVSKNDNFHHRPQGVGATNRVARIIWEQLRLPGAIRRDRIDVLFNPGFTGPIFPGCPQVTVFHDLQHKRHPEYFRWFDLPFWRVLLFAAVRRARRVIAVSQATKNDVLRFYKIDADDVRVVNHGVESELFQLNSVAAPEPVILCVSTLHAHKNLDGLLKAFAQFRTVNPTYKLVIVGLRGFYAQELEELRSQLNLADSVEFTGWISRADLYHFYTVAQFFVYPSRFEGFGMPIVEAAAAGLPVACSRIPVLQEVIGDAALFFEPDDPADICAALTMMARDRWFRADLQVKGRNRAAQFSWQKAARETLQVLTETAKSQPEFTL